MEQRRYFSSMRGADAQVDRQGVVSSAALRTVARIGHTYLEFVSHGVLRVTAALSALGAAASGLHRSASVASPHRACISAENCHWAKVSVDDFVIAQAQHQRAS